MRKVPPQMFTGKFTDAFPGIPVGMEQALWNYLAYGLQPGSFLTAILENDAFGAIAQADIFWTIGGLKSLVLWTSIYLPVECHGSRKALKYWMELTDDERYEKSTAVGLAPTVFDIIAGK